MPAAYLVFVGATLVASYFLGSISFGTLIARRYGIDITSQGSGNPGATNTLRVLGIKAGLEVFVLDALKGALPMLAVRYIVPHLLYQAGIANEYATHLTLLAYSLTFMAVVFGHIFSFFLNFKGGKGIATSVGAILAMDPLLGILLLGLFTLIVLVTRIVSVGSLVASTALVPVAVILGYRDPLPLCIMGFVSVVVIWAHRSNIKKLLRGEEARISDKKPGESA